MRLTRLLPKSMHDHTQEERIVQDITFFTPGTRHSNHSGEISAYVEYHPSVQTPNLHRCCRVMWPMLGRSTASPIQDLLRNAPQLLILPRAAHRDRLYSKLRICQRCYHHNLRALYSERGIIVAPRDDRHKIRPSRIAISKSYSRALSSGNTNAGDKPRSDLPSQEEGRRSHISKSFSHVMDNLQSNIFIAGQRLNDLTGYSGIEALKKDIEQQGR